MDEATITHTVVSPNLKNKGWVLSPESERRNVFFESDLPEKYKKKLRGKRPDLTLFHEGRPIGVIELKKSGAALDQAMAQAESYAKKLGAPLIFASNGAYCKTQYLPNGRPLKINDRSVSELLSYTEAVKFLEEETNEICTLEKEVIKSREELISVFKHINNTLRGEGLQAGNERFNEFANLLFLKLLSDGKKEEENYWQQIKNQKDNVLIGFINRTLLEQLKERYGGAVLEPLKIKAPATLRDVIAALDPLQLTSVEEDIKGGAFEYFLAKAPSAAKDLGEYFTPRHLVKMMVRLVDPKFGETIYDPFCGTGGFLTVAFDYIKNNNQLGRDALNTLKNHTLFGRELTRNARIAKMNMILHGDGHVGVERLDSLHHPVDGRYEVVLTNIPFSQRIPEGVSDRYYEGLAKKSGDALCLLHGFKALKPGGRMAVVVPEGFLFRNAEKQVRAFLLQRARLQSVISLPQGCFQPYTGTKTNILYFTDCHNITGPEQEKLWFFEVKNDGFTLDKKRNKLEGQNDLEKLEASKLYYDEKERETLESTGFRLVEMEKVKENSYQLIGKYYFQEEEKKTKYCLVELGEVLEYEQPTKYIVSSENYNDTYPTPVLTAGKSFILGFTNETKGVFPKEKLPVIIFDDFTTKVKYVDFPFKVKSSAMKILSIKDKLVSVNLIYQLMKQISFNSNTHKRYWISEYSKIKIPLPSVEEQKRIVARLEQHEKVIRAAQEIINSYPLPEIENVSQKVSLKEVCEIEFGNSAPQEKKLFINGDYPFFRVSDLARYHISDNLTEAADKLNKEGIKKLKLFKKGTILFPKSGASTLLNHRAMMGCDGYVTSHLACISKIAEEKIMKSFLFLVLLKTNLPIQNESYPSINKEGLEKIIIPLPSISKQKEIVKEFEARKKTITQSKELIKQIEKKMENEVSALWQAPENKEKR